MAAYHESAVSLRHPALIGLDVPVGLLYGPLLYLYVRTLTVPKRGLRWADAAHTLPFLALALFFAPFYARPGAEKLALLADPTRSFQTGALGVIGATKLLHAAVYLGLTVGLLRRHRRQIEETLASLDGVTLKWLRNLVLGAGALLAASAVLFVLGSYGIHPILGADPDGVADDLSLLGATVFVYTLGYFGLLQTEVVVRSVGPGPMLEDRAPYARSGMSAEDAAELRDRLLALMETASPHLRGDLTLQDLADALGVTPHNLTEVLSTQLGQSFYDFVNGRRVGEVQARLLDPAFAEWTVLAIGMEAGFNAKSSFNAAFRRHAGTTPSQYRQQHREPA